MTNVESIICSILIIALLAWSILFPIVYMPNSYAMRMGTCTICEHHKNDLVFIKDKQIVGNTTIITEYYVCKDCMVEACNNKECLKNKE